MADPARVGVDVGGTFTDAVLAVGGRVVTAKAPTTPHDQSEGVLAAVQAALDRAGTGADGIEAFAHGTTVATNALLEGRGARTALVATAPLTAQHAHKPDPDIAAKPAGAMPAGWLARTDRNAPVSQLSFVSMGRGFHAVTGPAAVLYNPATTRSGEFGVSYAFTQTKAPTHPEAYGLVLGGANLAGPEQAYSYFLVRGTGEYFIATRNGDQRTVIQNWIANPAINKKNAAGVATNVLGAEVKADEVIFTVNGTEIARRPKNEILTNGIVGFRVNHNLDVHIEPAR
ncbi:MAG: hypothetical protein KY464_16975 [Gemmatimonadetes bacterium]|nr:hypothetical protein [Gemmatimonadota bacterium]